MDKRPRIGQFILALAVFSVVLAAAFALAQTPPTSTASPPAITQPSADQPSDATQPGTDQPANMDTGATGAGTTTPSGTGAGPSQPPPGAVTVPEGQPCPPGTVPAQPQPPPGAVTVPEGQPCPPGTVPAEEAKPTPPPTEEVQPTPPPAEQPTEVTPAAPGAGPMEEERVYRERRPTVMRERRVVYRMRPYYMPAAGVDLSSFAWLGSALLGAGLAIRRRTK